MACKVLRAAVKRDIAVDAESQDVTAYCAPAADYLKAVVQRLKTPTVDNTDRCRESTRFLLSGDVARRLLPVRPGCESASAQARKLAADLPAMKRSRNQQSQLCCAADRRYAASLA